MKKTFERFSIFAKRIQRDHDLINEHVNFIQSFEQNSLGLAESLLKSLWKLHNDGYWVNMQLTNKAVSSILSAECVQFARGNPNNKDTQAYINILTSLRDDVQLTVKLLSEFCSNAFLFRRLSFIVYTAVATFSIMYTDVKYVENVVWEFFLKAISETRSISNEANPWLPLLSAVFLNRSTSVTRYINALLKDVLTEAILAFHTCNIAATITKDSGNSGAESPIPMKNNASNHITFSTVLFIEKLRETLDLFPASYLQLLARLRFHLRASDNTHLVNRISVNLVFYYLVKQNLIFSSYSLFSNGLILTPCYRKVLNNLWFAVNAVAQLTLHDTIRENEVNGLMNKFGPTAADIVSDTNIIHMKNTLDRLFHRADRLGFPEHSTKTIPQYQEFVQLNNQPQAKSQSVRNSNCWASFMKLTVISQTDLGILTDACRLLANWGHPIPKRLQKALNNLPERLDGALIHISLIPSEKSGKNTKTKHPHPTQNQGQHHSLSTGDINPIFLPHTSDIRSVLKEKPDPPIHSSPTSPVRSDRDNSRRGRLQQVRSSFGSLEAITPNVSAAKQFFTKNTKLGSSQSPSSSPSRRATSATPKSEFMTARSTDENLSKCYNSVSFGDCCTRCCLYRGQRDDLPSSRCSCVFAEPRLTHSQQSSHCDFHEPVDERDGNRTNNNSLVSAGANGNPEPLDQKPGDDVDIDDNLHSGDLLDGAHFRTTTAHTHHHDGNQRGVLQCGEEEDRFSNISTSLHTVSSASSTASALSSLPSGFTSLASSAHALGTRLRAAVATSGPVVEPCRDSQSGGDLVDGEQDASVVVKQTPVSRVLQGGVSHAPVTDIHELDERSSAITCSSCGVRFANGHEEEEAEEEEERELDDDEDEAGQGGHCRHIASCGDICSGNHGSVLDEDALSRVEAEDGTLSDLHLSSANVSGRVTPLSLASSQSRGLSVEQRGYPAFRPLAAGFVLPNETADRCAADLNLHHTLMQHHRHHQHAASDVTEKFGKFDLPPVRAPEHEARSTVSDTWSTDVLASDTEYSELGQDLPELVATGASSALSNSSHRHHNRHCHSRDNNNHHLVNHNHRAHRHRHNRSNTHQPPATVCSSQPPASTLLQGASTSSDSREGTPGISILVGNLEADVFQDTSEKKKTVDADHRVGSLSSSPVDSDDLRRRGQQAVLPPPPPPPSSGETVAQHQQPPSEGTPEPTSLMGHKHDRVATDPSTIGCSTPTVPSTSGSLVRLSESVKESCSRLKGKLDSITWRPRFADGEPGISESNPAGAKGSAVYSQSDGQSRASQQLPSPDPAVRGEAEEPWRSCSSDTSPTKTLAAAAATVVKATCLSVTGSSSSSSSLSTSASAPVVGQRGFCRTSHPPDCSPPQGQPPEQTSGGEAKPLKADGKESVEELIIGASTSRQRRPPHALRPNDQELLVSQQQGRHKAEAGTRRLATPIHQLWQHVIWGFWLILTDPTAGQLLSDAIWDSVLLTDDTAETLGDKALVDILSYLLVDPLLLQTGLTTTVEETRNLLETLLLRIHADPVPTPEVASSKAVGDGLRCPACSGAQNRRRPSTPVSDRVTRQLLHDLGRLRHRRRCAYLFYLEETRDSLRRTGERLRLLKDRSESDLMVIRLRRLHDLLARFLDSQLLSLRQLYNQLTVLVFSSHAGNMSSSVDSLTVQRHALVSRVIDQLVDKWLASTDGRQLPAGQNSTGLVRQIVERLVMEKIYESGCWTNDSVTMQARDDIFHRELANLQGTVSLVDLHIRNEFHVLQPFRSAQRELRLLNCSHLPADMTSCLKLLMAKIVSSIQLIRPGLMPGADELLPILIFVIIQANPPRLLTNLDFMEAFGIEGQLQGEDQYIWCQFRAAGLEVRRLLSDNLDTPAPR